MKYQEVRSKYKCGWVFNWNEKQGKRIPQKVVFDKQLYPVLDCERVVMLNMELRSSYHPKNPFSFLPLTVYKKEKDCIECNLDYSI